MKKIRKALTAIISFALCATVLTSGASAASANATYIGDAKAKEIALADAKVKSADAKYMTCEFEYDDGTPVYDVEFHYSSTEYNYEINAKNGKIISREKDNYGSNVPSTGGVYIGKADAKEIAFKEAGINANDAKKVRVTFEYDDGIAEYTVEFHANSLDYDYEIDAVTGSIISADIEKDFAFSDIFFIRWISSFFSFIGGIFN